MEGSENRGPHQGQPVREAGAPLGWARAAMVMAHGRGAGAAGILGLADLFAQPDVAYLAPEAAGRTWYPYSFLAPLERNEPYLSSALRALGDVLARLAEEGVPPERTLLLGFSQGACLASEYAARHPQRYGGLVVLSGGLIGSGQRADAAPPDDKAFDYDGSLAGTPVFLGCSDVDPHIPVARVHRTAEVMRGLGGDVTERIYEGMGHTIVEDEVRFVRRLLADLPGL